MPTVYFVYHLPYSHLEERNVLVSGLNLDQIIDAGHAIGEAIGEPFDEDQQFLSPLSWDSQEIADEPCSPDEIRAALKKVWRPGGPYDNERFDPDRGWTTVNNH